jgi:aspartyl-tRNA(Asn)/glutamyl-tRNA(Gln) amidotransferase subunit B
VEAIRSELPELPEARRDRFEKEYGLPPYDANLLTGSREMADYFENCVREKPHDISLVDSAKKTAIWILGEVNRITNTHNIDIVDFEKKVQPKQLVGLWVAESKAVVNTATAKSMLEEIFNTGKDPDTILKEGERGQISDTRQLEEAARQVMLDNAQALADYKAGKEPALKFLVGQVMKATKGRANPKLVNELLKRKLEEE